MPPAVFRTVDTSATNVLTKLYGLKSVFAETNNKAIEEFL